MCSFTIGFDITSKDERIFAKIAADEFSTLHFEKILSQSFLNLLICLDLQSLSYDLGDKDGK